METPRDHYLPKTKKKIFCVLASYSRKPYQTVKIANFINIVCII